MKIALKDFRIHGLYLFGENICSSNGISIALASTEIIANKTPS